jgi:hypothetical protein
VVATPEVPALHLAREKLNYLRRLELGECERVVEPVLGGPVQYSFANDCQGVQKALTAGKPVD